MARINFETCWWSDPRRSALARKFNGSVAMADGCAVNAWRLSQEHWKKDKGLIPKSIFKLIEGWQELIEVELAEDRGDFVYVRGAAEHHEWILERTEAGRLGGLAKASKRLANASTSLANVKQTLPSSSSSSSSSKKEKQAFAAQTAVALSPNAERQEISSLEKVNAVTIWCSEYLRAYGFNYDVGKQDAGMLQNYAKGKSAEKVQLAFACYFAIKEPFYEKAKHPVSLFFRDRAKIHAAAQTGVDPSKKKTGLDEWFESVEGKK